MKNKEADVKNDKRYIDFLNGLLWGAILTLATQFVFSYIKSLIK
jgi:hypothetical protein